MSVQRQSRRQSVKAKPPSRAYLRKAIRGLDIAEQALYACQVKGWSVYTASDMQMAEKVIETIAHTMKQFLRTLKGGPE